MAREVAAMAPVIDPQTRFPGVSPRVKESDPAPRHPRIPEPAGFRPSNRRLTRYNGKHRLPAACVRTVRVPACGRPKSR
jgi:hypothetical protein